MPNHPFAFAAIAIARRALRMIAAVELPRLAAALAGLLALWLGCDLANAPLQIGGPMNLSFNLPVGVPLVGLGVIGVARAPDRVWVLAWSFAGIVALATAGVNFWHGIPVEDGAFQAMRAGVPDPDTWPAPAFLHALALAPVGVAIGALLPGPRRIGPLLLGSAGAAVGSSLGLQAFTDALLQYASGAGLVIGAVTACSLIAGVAAWGRHPAGRAIAGQAVVLAVLILVVWVEYR